MDESKKVACRSRQWELMPRCAARRRARSRAYDRTVAEARTAPPPVVAKCADSGWEEGVDPCAAGHLPARIANWSAPTAEDMRPVYGPGLPPL